MIEQDGMANSQDYSTISEASNGASIARRARLTARQAFTGSLATLDNTSDYPFASLVSVAISAVGEPVFLLSGLARHTKNIAENPKASLLLEAVHGRGDPLQAARVSLQGDVEITTSDACRARYLARHPEAARYADFSDFSFYRMHVVQAHFIAGFARIHALSRADFCLPDTAANLDVGGGNGQPVGQADTQQSILKRAWRSQVGTEPREPMLEIIAYDRDGFDVRSGEAVQRLDFPSIAESGAALDDVLATLDPAAATT